MDPQPTVVKSRMLEAIQYLRQPHKPARRQVVVILYDPGPAEECSRR
jgi:hypothetical protein